MSQNFGIIFATYCFFIVVIPTKEKPSLTTLHPLSAEGILNFKLLVIMQYRLLMYLNFPTNSISNVLYIFGSSEICQNRCPWSTKCKECSNCKWCSYCVSCSFPNANCKYCKVCEDGPRDCVTCCGY